MLVQLFTLRREHPGTLSTMARPCGGDWLDDEMQNLASRGVTTLVSLLTPEEELALDLTNERAAAEKAGLTFVSFPIADRETTLVDELDEALSIAETDLANAGHVVVHCRMGIGRSSMFAGAILVRGGLAPAQAWRVISEARGLSVPDTEAQRRWLDEFVEN